MPMKIAKINNLMAELSKEEDSSSGCLISLQAVVGIKFARPPPPPRRALWLVFLCFGKYGTGLSESGRQFFHYYII